MSAILPKADMVCQCSDVRFVPKADVRTSTGFKSRYHGYTLFIVRQR
jgi:hypothetical protein